MDLPPSGLQGKYTQVQHGGWEGEDKVPAMQNVPVKTKQNKTKHAPPDTMLGTFPNP